eukprot:TRINITY_DN15737_c0_g1_i1.p1 TRINITY_DN15737_c0_g1~~TRINITY_DN15737_c0_g1_i1.p1  ORF type:complete len:146 (-),score=26.28 TRINITY_DN15737_c0_g1_i1:173-610(-)
MAIPHIPFKVAAVGFGGLSLASFGYASMNRESLRNSLFGNVPTEKEYLESWARDHKERLRAADFVKDALEKPERPFNYWQDLTSYRQKIEDETFQTNWYAHPEFVGTDEERAAHRRKHQLPVQSKHFSPQFQFPDKGRNFYHNRS